MRLLYIMLPWTVTVYMSSMIQWPSCSYQSVIICLYLTVCSLVIQMVYNKAFSFTVEPMSLRLAATETKCTFTICKGDCSNKLTCKVTIPIYNKHFIMTSELESHQGCTQQIAVWEALQPDTGVLKVKAQNSKEVDTLL